MIRRPPRSTRTDTLLSLHDALPICRASYSNPLLRVPPYRVRRRPATRDRCRRRPETARPRIRARRPRSEEHTSELQSLMRISYAVFCLKKTNKHNTMVKPETRHPEI